MAMSNASLLAEQNLQIWKKIGEGTFSKVYLTKYGDTVDDKVMLVATKIIDKNRVSAKFVAKFLPRELDILLKLSHPFIVKMYSMYQYGYKIFINMEYADNGNLYTYLQNHSLTEPQIRSWIVQILWAFRYMHGEGVVHRDLKCENILLTSDYNLRIADFGFARFVGPGRNPIVETVCGTVAYSSPELLAGTRPYNPMAVDVWAIGIVLFMMANNVVPFREKHKENMYKKQMAKEYAFRKVLGRSDTLKKFTSKFLEPIIQHRVQLKYALQDYWIQIGNIETPTIVRYNTIEKNNNISTVPIITESRMRSSKFNYQMADYAKSISKFNDAFARVKNNKDSIFIED